MPRIEHIGTDIETERELFVLDIPTLDDLPRTLDTAGKYSTILVVSGALRERPLKNADWRLSYQQLRIFIRAFRNDSCWRHFRD